MKLSCRKDRVRGNERERERDWSLPVLMRPAHGDISLHSDGQGHVDAGTEGYCGHWVQDVDVELWEGFKKIYIFPL